MQNKIASRYAKALFSAVMDLENVDVTRCAEALSSLAVIYEENITVKEVLSCPTISPQEKKGLMVEFLTAMGVALPVLESFIATLVNSGRIPFIGSIAETFQMLLDEKSHIKRGLVSTSHSVDDASKGLIQDFVEKQFKDPVLLTYSVEPALLGGFVLKVDDSVYDASLKTQLANLKENIKKGVY